MAIETFTIRHNDNLTKTPQKLSERFYFLWIDLNDEMRMTIRWEDNTDLTTVAKILRIRDIKTPHVQYKGKGSHIINADTMRRRLQEML